MKYFILILVMFALFGCGATQEESGENPVNPPAEPEVVDKMVGNWSMDSSVFISNGVRGQISPPLMPTVWTFGNDGSYQVKNSVTMTGTYSRSEDSLFVVLMAVPNEYEILVLNETNLHLRSTIVEVDTASVKTDAYLTRITE